MKGKKLVAIILTILLLIIVVINLFYGVNFASFTSPDEDVNYNYGVYGKEYRLIFEENIPSNPHKISDRGSLIMSDGSLVPIKFIGYPMIISVFNSVFHKKFLFVLVFVALGLILGFNFLLSKEVIKKRYIQIILLLFTIIVGALLYYTAKGFIEDTLATGFLLVALFYFIRMGDESPSTVILIVSLSAFSIFVKPLFAVYALPLVIFALIKTPRNWKRNLSIIMITFVLIFIPMFYWNSQLYGFFLKTGPSSTFSSSLFVVSEDASFFTRMVNSYMGFATYASIFPLIILSLLFGVLMIYQDKKFSSKIGYLTIFHATTSILILVYLFGFSGARDFTDITSSVFRYTLPSQLMSLVITASFFDRKKIAKRYSIIFITVAIILFSTQAFFPMKEVGGVISQREFGENIKNSIINKLNQRGIEVDKFVLITDGFDKFVFPEIKTTIVHKEFAERINLDKNYELSICKALEYYDSKGYSVGVILYDMELLERDADCISEKDFDLSKFEMDGGTYLFLLK